jgi:hypothetical protein
MHLISEVHLFFAEFPECPILLLKQQEKFAVALQTEVPGLPS